jgi:hypothetical protein
MPPPKAVKKLEKMKRKGLDVDYPRAPWFTDNEEALKKEKMEKNQRIRDGQHAAFLKKFPASRTAGQSLDKVRVEKTDLPSKFKLP